MEKKEKPIDLSDLPNTNIVPITNKLREANIKIEDWMPAAMGICNSLALKEKVNIGELRKVNQAIVDKMVKSEKELSGSDYLKAFEKIMGRNGISIDLDAIEKESRRIVNGK